MAAIDNNSQWTELPSH